MSRLQSTFRADAKYKPFFLSMIVFGVAYGLYKGIIDNYLAEIVTMTEFDKGVSEFFRELPGLTFVFILAALYMFPAKKLLDWLRHYAAGNVYARSCPRHTSFCYSVHFDIFAGGTYADGNAKYAFP